MGGSVGLFGAHGQFCASHPWEVIVATLTLVACAWSVEKRSPGSGNAEETCAGWATHCPGLEAEYQAADAVLMTVVRCLALLYAYYQFSNLHKLASKYLIAIAAVFATFASFIFTSALVNLFWSDVANLKDAPFLFLLAADVSRGTRLARAGGGAGRRGLGGALARLGPAATLDTLLSVLLVGVGSLSAVPRLDHLCKFACLALVADYLVFLTFYPACLSLVMEFSSSYKEGSSSKCIDSDTEYRPNPVVQRVKMIMAGGLLCVHLRSRWSWKDEEQSLQDGIMVSPNRSLNNAQDELLHPYVKWFSMSADHIVILTLLCALAVKFIFFEEREELDDMSDTEEKSLSTQVSSMELAPRKAIFTISDSTSYEEKGIQTEWTKSKNEDAVEITGSKPGALCKKVRSLPECLEVYRSDAGGAALTDDEVVMLVEQSHIPLYKLETVLDDTLRGVKLRRKIIAQQFLSAKVLEGLPYLNYDYSRVLNACCENVIGYVGIPVGYAGPLIVDGHPYIIPLATTEGALVASTNRGCKAIGARGITSVVDDVGMTRAPAVSFTNVTRAHEARKWIENKDNFDIIKAAFDGTSRFAKLQEIHIGTDGPVLYIRFRATTGDAMGMNMVSKGAEMALNLIKKYFPDMEVVSLSGNYCSDKKAAAINWIKGRGKRVVCETTISGETLRKIFKVDAKTLSRCNKLKNLTGSALAGSIGGNNAHAANIVTAIFIATGQDPAQNVTSSYCSTSMETRNNDEDLYITCTMPSLEVGTIGGGTVLEGQSACLETLGVKGSGNNPAENAGRLASIVCAAVLAAELSLMAALVNSDLVKSHMRHNRSTANMTLLSPDQMRSKSALDIPSATL